MSARRSVQQVKPLDVVSGDRAEFVRPLHPGVIRGCVICKVTLQADARSFPILCDDCGSRKLRQLVGGR